MNKIISSNDKYWYALYTRPRAEFKAAEQIEAIGIEYYLPTITRLKQWSDRKKKITEPILKGYIFIFANEHERINSLGQYSVIRCVSERGKAARIPQWQIDNLKKMLETRSEFHIYEGIIPGAKVRIKEGPFNGVIGTVQESENGKTIAVSIDLLNRSVIAHLPRESIFELIK
jgi:transcription antitermination factor NusG